MGTGSGSSIGRGCLHVRAAELSPLPRFLARSRPYEAYEAEGCRKLWNLGGERPEEGDEPRGDNGQRVTPQHKQGSRGFG